MLARLAIWVLLCFPLAVVFRSMPAGSAARHVFSCVAGALGLYFVTSAQHLAHVLAIALTTHLIVRVAPARLAGPLVFAASFAHVLAVHVARADLLEGVLGPAHAGSARAVWEGAFAVRKFQTAVMAAMLKATGFAFSLSDGARSPGGAPAPGMHAAHAAVRLSRAPSALRFAGYMLFFPAVLGHPSYFSYAEYEAAAADSDAQRCAASSAARAPCGPVAWAQIAMRMLEGAAFGALHAQAVRFLPRCSAGHYEPLACYAYSVLSYARFYVRGRAARTGARRAPRRARAHGLHRARCARRAAARRAAVRRAVRRPFGGCATAQSSSQASCRRSISARRITSRGCATRCSRPTMCPRCATGTCPLRAS